MIRAAHHSISSIANGMFVMNTEEIVMIDNTVLVTQKRILHIGANACRSAVETLMIVPKLMTH